MMFGKRFVPRCGAAALFLASLLLLRPPIHAQFFPHIFTFQGRLCTPEGKPLPDGPYAVTFTIYDYDAQTGGNALWTETQGVTQVGGVFVAYLGSATPFPADLFAAGDRWLGIKVAGDPEMPERIRLTPSPWAIHAAEADLAKEAGNADTLDGFYASETPGSEKLLALGADARWPLSTIPQGHGSGLDADLLDGRHGSDFWSKAEGGPFVELAPAAPQAGAQVALVGGGMAPTVTLVNEGPALRAIRTDGEEGWSWRQMYPSTAPVARFGHVMAYDAESDRVILFGGSGYALTYLGDTWALAGSYMSSPAAEFVGSVHIEGDLLVEGEKNAVVPTESFGERKVYCQESTEVWFEHIGSARLVDGRATIDLDPVFLETVTIDAGHPMQVFITPYAPMGEYWVQRGERGFTVHAAAPTVGSEFGYRVVAKRRGYENELLAPTDRREKERR